MEVRDKIKLKKGGQANDFYRNVYYISTTITNNRHNSPTSSIGSKDTGKVVSHVRQASTNINDYRPYIMFSSLFSRV